MFTIFVLLVILVLIIVNVKRLAHNYEINKCSGCRGNCNACSETGSSLIERYHQGKLGNH